MITKLNVRDEAIARKVLDVQIPSYKVEAELINFDGIPPLKDTVDTIVQSKETFLGYLIEEELMGVISYTETQNQVHICRLVVHPNHFRKGIAKTLVEYFLKNIGKDKKAIVSTGAKNFPAKNLYKWFGFQKVKDVEVAPGILVTLFKN